MYSENLRIYNITYNKYIEFNKLSLKNNDNIVLYLLNKDSIVDKHISYKIITELDQLNNYEYSIKDLLLEEDNGFLIDDLYIDDIPKIQKNNFEITISNNKLILKDIILYSNNDILLYFSTKNNIINNYIQNDRYFNPNNTNNVISLKKDIKKTNEIYNITVLPYIVNIYYNEYKNIMINLLSNNEIDNVNIKFKIENNGHNITQYNNEQLYYNGASLCKIINPIPENKLLFRIINNNKQSVDVDFVIKFYIANNENICAYCKVNIYKNYIKTSRLNIFQYKKNNIVYDINGKLTLDYNETVQLIPSFEPYISSDKQVIWENKYNEPDCSGIKSFNIDNYGNITGLFVPQTIYKEYNYTDDSIEYSINNLYCRIYNNFNVYCKLPIYVKRQYIKVERINMLNENIYVKENDEFELIVMIYPDTATNKKINWVVTDNINDSITNNKLGEYIELITIDNDLYNKRLLRAKKYIDYPIYIKAYSYDNENIYSVSTIKYNTFSHIVYPSKIKAYINEKEINNETINKNYGDNFDIELKFEPDNCNVNELTLEYDLDYITIYKSNENNNCYNIYISSYKTENKNTNIKIQSKYDNNVYTTINLDLTKKIIPVNNIKLIYNNSEILNNATIKLPVGNEQYFINIKYYSADNKDVSTESIKESNIKFSFKKNDFNETIYKYNKKYDDNNNVTEYDYIELVYDNNYLNIYGFNCKCTADGDIITKQPIYNFESKPIYYSYIINNKTINSNFNVKFTSLQIVSFNLYDDDSKTIINEITLNSYSKKDISIITDPELKYIAEKDRELKFEYDENYIQSIEYIDTNDVIPYSKITISTNYMSNYVEQYIKIKHNDNNIVKNIKVNIIQSIIKDITINYNLDPNVIYDNNIYKLYSGTEYEFNCVIVKNNITNNNENISVKYDYTNDIISDNINVSDIENNCFTIFFETNKFSDITTNGYININCNGFIKNIKIEILEKQNIEDELETIQTIGELGLNKDDEYYIVSYDDNAIDLTTSKLYLYDSINKTEIEITYSDISHLIKFNILPNCDCIKIIDTDNNIYYLRISDNLKYNIEDDKPIYKIGLLSDTHYADKALDTDDPDSLIEDAEASSYFKADLNNALNFFKEENVNMICIAGDVTTDHILHLDNFFDLYTAETSRKIPIFACQGNHDCHALYRSTLETTLPSDAGDTLKLSDYDGEIFNDCIDIWKTMFGKNSGIEKHYACDDEKYDVDDKETSFYIEYNNDIFIFLDLFYTTGSSVSAEQTDEYYGYYYRPETLEWFEDRLEEFKNRRCFVFTHLFFKHKAGNISNGNGWSYVTNRRDNYVLNDNGKYNQFTFLNDLNNTYKNVIWFTGHSHYKWNSQQYDPNVIVCNYCSDKGIDSAYNIHLPSLAQPIYGNKGSNSGGSEGAIMEVYKDYVIIKGIVFCDIDDNDPRKITTILNQQYDESYINKYYIPAFYKINIKNTGES